MRPSIMINPRTDVRFAEAVAAALDGIETPDVLADVLRARYPHVVVRPRSLSGEPVEIWYIYRDGHWVNPEGERSDVDDRR